MKPSKILHISTALSWRGGEQQQAYLIEGLKKKDIESLVVCAKGGRMEAFCIANKIKHFPVKKRFSLNLLFAKSIARIARKESVEIVHPHDSHAHTFSVLAASLFAMKTAIVLHRRVDYPVQDSVFSTWKYNHSQIKKVICVSNEVKRVLDKNIKDSRKISVVHSGIDLTKFDTGNSTSLKAEFSIDDNKIAIGNASAITQQKDYFTFVETAEILLNQNKNFHFFIIGDGDQRAEIELLTKQKNIFEHFTFTGFRKDVANLLPSLDVFLFTSEKEGLGTSVLDAMAAKVPIVSTNVGGVPEMIQDGFNGFLAPIKNPKLLAEKVLTLIKQPNLQKNLAAEAFKTVQQFSKEKMTEGVLNVYQKALES